MDPLIENLNRVKPMLPARRAGERPRDLVQTKVPEKAVFDEPRLFPFRPEYLSPIPKVNHQTTKILALFERIASHREVAFNCPGQAEEIYADVKSLLKLAKSLQKGIKHAGGKPVEIPKHFYRNVKK